MEEFHIRLYKAQNNQLIIKRISIDENITLLRN